jgi:hypothetical protein
MKKVLYITDEYAKAKSKRDLRLKMILKKKLSPDYNYLKDIKEIQVV